MKKTIAVLLAFLLTGSLILFCVSFVGRQVIAPAMGEDGAQVSDAVVREEYSLVQEHVKELAELYGFEAEPVISLISEDKLRELHTQASQWWSSILRDGKVGEEIKWYANELEETLLSDDRLSRMEDRDRADYLAAAGAEDVRRSIIRMVLPMRQQTIRLGIQKVGERVDIPNVVTFFLGMPWAVLALCALLAGLIALLENRKPGDAWHYIGSALGGAALVMILLIILYLSAGFLPMIREASAGLAVQYRSVASGAVIRAGILTAVMAAGCVLLLTVSRKDGKTA